MRLWGGLQEGPLLSMRISLHCRKVLSPIVAPLRLEDMFLSTRNGLTVPENYRVSPTGSILDSELILGSNSSPAKFTPSVATSMLCVIMGGVVGLG